MEIKKIATIRNDYTGSFGIPRQSGVVPSVESRIIFEKEYRNADAIRGIEDFSHLWLIWNFSEVPVSDRFIPTVRPPKLGGNTRVGVFATRSPFRPNALGLTVVRFVRTESGPEGPALVVTGADLKNGTPIYDIKPYIPYADSVPDAVGGWAEEHANDRLTVHFSKEAREGAAALGFNDAWLTALSEVIAADPRPAYQEDPDRRYGMRFGAAEAAFYVKENKATVTEIVAADAKI